MIVECNIPTIKNILQINRSLVTAKMFGFEGADVYEVIKNVSIEFIMLFLSHEFDRQAV